MQAGVVWAILLAGSSGGTSVDGQIVAPPPAMPQNPHGPPGMNRPGDDNSLPPGVLERQELARQTDRQKKLVADTDKLLALATELKADVSKTNKDVLSVDVIKKADEIEKLAHSVKERMKG